MEFGTEVTIEEYFEDWSNEDKYDLIRAIVNGESYEFTGETTVCIEPPDIC